MILLTRVNRGMFLSLMIAFILLDVASGKRAKKKLEISDHYQALVIITAISLLLIVPSLATFIYSIIKDPDTPEVYRKLKDVVKEKTIGNLSRRRQQVERA
jgi:hypothetical protein